MSFRTPGPATGERDLRDMVRSLYDGKSNNTGSVTLRAGETTTVVTDPRIGGGSAILLTPLSAHAAAALGGLWVSARATGSATLSHASTADTDKAFAYVVVG